MLDERSHLFLRTGLGLVALIFGITKVFEISYWLSYVAPWFLKLWPLSDSSFIILAAIGEIIVGILLLSKRFTRIGAIIACFWLTMIIINLLTINAYDIALRDLGLFAMALTLSLN